MGYQCVKLRNFALSLTPSHWEGEPCFPPVGGIEGGQKLRISADLMTLNVLYTIFKKKDYLNRCEHSYNE